MDSSQVDPAWIAHAKLAFAALCGGMIRLLFRPAKGEKASHRILKSIWLLFGCVTCGFYGTPPIMEWWAFSESYAGAVGALLGLLGLSIAEGLLKAVDGFEFKAWILSLLGSKKA